MTQRAPVFDQIMRDYLQQVAGLGDRPRLGEVLGITILENGFRVPYFDRAFTITGEGITDEQGTTPSHATSVVLCKYLLLCPDRPPADGSLLTYKDFKDGTPYVAGFKNTAEHPIARHFNGNLPALEKKCRQLGGGPFDTDVSCQLAFRFQALPQVPVFLLFNDADEDFPAQCSLLFRQSAAAYLDMECIAMVGSTLAYRLKDM
jgi:hypothetical protein